MIKTNHAILRLIALSTILLHPTISNAKNPPSPANNIEYPKNLTNWRVIGTSVRNDNDTQRVILGNAIAIKAARAKTAARQWPKDAILAKLVWKNDTLTTWKAATVPGNFIHTEIMVRDAKKYATTGGWGFARWKGLELEPHGKDGRSADTCFSCHQGAKEMDFVFTVPAKMP